MSEPCKHVFSNGTEYEWFLSNNCYRCTRYRNGKCRVFNALENARWDESLFPFADLAETKITHTKFCIRMTTDKPKRIRNKKQIEGQTEIEVTP